jgi:hypothetical protein
MPIVPDQEDYGIQTKCQKELRDFSFHRIKVGRKSEVLEVGFEEIENDAHWALTLYS